VEALEQHGVRPLLILDYGNPLYDDNLAPHTDEGRRAMAAWAAAAVAHFKGRGVMWEMWNEPNSLFWKPNVNVADYTRLALEVGEAIEAVAPDELYVGPATLQHRPAVPRGLLRGRAADALGCRDGSSLSPVESRDRGAGVREAARPHRALHAAWQGRFRSSAASGATPARGAASARAAGRVPAGDNGLTNFANNVADEHLVPNWHRRRRRPEAQEHHFGTVLHARRDPATQRLRRRSRRIAPMRLV
jgi:hypothetical protein